MELSWSTFVLEVVNFLILVWILKRFLYRPILAVLARRRAEIAKSLSDAEAVRKEAQAMEGQYQNRLAQWEQEKEAAHTALRAEIEAERARLMDELKTALAQEREKARAMDERRVGEARRKTEETALRHGAQFVTRLLSRIAGPELETRLLDLVIAELPGLPADHIADAQGDAAPVAAVTSAYALNEEQRRRLIEALSRRTGKNVACDFHEDAQLIAGLRIGIGAWVLRANLQDELAAFVEAGHDAR